MYLRGELALFENLLKSHIASATDKFCTRLGMFETVSLLNDTFCFCEQAVTMSGQCEVTDKVSVDNLLFGDEIVLIYPANHYY